MTGAAIGAASAGGVRSVSAAMTMGCGARPAGAVRAGSTRVVSCGAMAVPPAATLTTAGILLAAVALVSSTDTATKPRNSTTGSHWTAIRDRAFALMFNTPRPGRCNGS